MSSHMRCARCHAEGRLPAETGWTGVKTAPLTPIAAALSTGPVKELCPRCTKHLREFLAPQAQAAEAVSS